MISEAEPVPPSASSSPESHIPLSEKMKKRRTPALFEKNASGSGEVKRVRIDVPKEGTNKTGVVPSTAPTKVS